MRTREAIAQIGVGTSPQPAFCHASRDRRAVVHYTII
jgi:hypothetical protein